MSAKNLVFVGGTTRFIAPQKLKNLTIVNRATTSATFKINGVGDSITINSNVQVELEEVEARAVERIEFVGTTGATIQVIWV